MPRDDVLLWNMRPQQNAPSYGTVCQLANDVYGKRVESREGGWKYPRHKPGSIVPGTGVYVPDVGIRAEIGRLRKPVA
jgi:hypothetical protein